MGSTSTKIKLRTSDQKVFEVEEAVVVQSQTIKYFYENGCPGSVIHVHSVSGDILSKILNYCKKHVNSTAGKEDISPEELYEWDANFVKAANCLKIESLLDLTCQTVANMIKGKRPEEIRTTFNIKNDYTPEAEEAVRRENKWAFDMLGV
ncbi:hypothetical protein ERO13_A12G037000v2 [Gossypium hirsutum]|uniref:SKP1-like protein n=1 Tax=Gossypium hirsutum TaxID=3635 RepID=A0A1U8LZL2_GOSHI|nr:SKP1-like protein 1A isoform X2 [Gossypium hirsutum]KAG4168627.1 hypothetical protein ERO13_A12G037000v2 [Gossypium hirsutum]